MYKPFEPFTIGMMVEIDWVIEDVHEVQTLFIITRLERAGFASNGEIHTYPFIEVYRVNEARYYKLELSDMERWLSNGNLRIIHDTKEIKS